MFLDGLKAAFLGIVEGLTEYIPVSSTGHLLLLRHFFGFSDEAFGNTFAVLIQLGAILALLSIYFVARWRRDRLFIDPKRGASCGVLIAFLPAAVIGAIFHDFIKNVLFNPWIVCFSLIAGGAVLIMSISLDLKPRYHDATGFSLPMYSASACASASPWSPACRGPAPPSWRRCCSAPTAARRRNSRSISRCRPWRGVRL